MRFAVSAFLMVAWLAGCAGPESEIVPVQLRWMEWPAEVRASQAFPVRLVGFGVGCREVVHFDPGATVDNSAVTFEPFFLVRGQAIACPLEVSQAGTAYPIAAFFDTVASVEGLATQTSRSYEVRGTADVSVQGATPAAIPVRTFGEIVVRTGSIDASRTNAGGIAYAERDTAACVTIFVGVGTRYVVENPPADTATFWSAFVRGYIYEPATPVCGADSVFHLISRE